MSELPKQIVPQSDESQIWSHVLKTLNFSNFDVDCPEQLSKVIRRLEKLADPLLVLI